MDQYNNKRYLMIKHVDDPSGRDPVTIITRCYWEVIGSRYRLPKEMITTTTSSITTKGDTVIDDVTVDNDDETSASTCDRAVKRSRIESSVVQEAVQSRHCFIPFVDTSNNNEIITRTIVEHKGIILYTTIDVKLMSDSAINPIKFEEDIIMTDSNEFYLAKLTEVFKNLFKEIIGYLYIDEADLFLINVINDMTNMMGIGTVYVYAALWTLNYLYLATGNTENIKELKKEIDLYQNICDIMDKYFAQVVAKNYAQVVAKKMKN